ncbi:MAG: glycerate kinase [Calditrichia bacterium]|jgi:glycerate-2-kinase|nr:glycerate kinase [Calditrichia bacterium]
MNQELKKAADQIIKAALNAVDPYQLIREQVIRKGDTLVVSEKEHIELSQFDRIFLCGAGKGAAPITRAMEELLSDRLDGGDIIVKYDHLAELQKINLHEAAHPVPDENGLRSTEILLTNLDNLTERDCVFVLLTGGGSALLESLPDEIKLDDLQKLSSVLLQCSATIHEINCIRKHISLIKGGQLAKKIYPARCVTLALSDVIGDDLSVIASGPTSPDPTTFDDALAILEKYNVTDKIPTVILNHLKRGSEGKIPDTPKREDQVFKKVTNIVIGNNRLALNKAKETAESLGFKTIILTSMLEGEAREIARVVASIISEVQVTGTPIKKPACILLGGEPTVKIQGTGKGGRNQELALAVALSNINEPYVCVSVGSDGTDGPTDAAGAIVDHTTLSRAESAGLNAQEYLKNNDSYNFFAPLGDLIITGPTGTNVMDVIFALVP